MQIRDVGGLGSVRSMGARRPRAAVGVASGSGGGPGPRGRLLRRPRGRPLVGLDGFGRDRRDPLADHDDPGRAHQHDDLVGDADPTTRPQLCRAARRRAVSAAEGRAAPHGRGSSHQGPASALDGLLRDQHVGGVALLGTWNGAASVSAAVQHWQTGARDADAGIGALVAADQEGGQVQHLQGAGFTSTPSALDQGRSPAVVARTAAAVGAQLHTVGVSVALAPVADTVSIIFAPRNAPIGALDREYGHDPATVGAAVQAAVGALPGAGVSATLKHFPGLGRVTGNTDLTASGTTDTTMTSDDAYVQPFRAGIAAGADLVLVSSALYPRIDPDHRAVFSRAVVTGVLRERLGFSGVVVTDDVGGAAAVADVPVGDRATQFVAAGGDIVLTGLPATVPAMADALVGRAAADPAFAAQVDTAVKRVLDLKIRRGVAACG